MQIGVIAGEDSPQMTAYDRILVGEGSPLRILARSFVSTGPSLWRWRLAGLILVLAYVVQNIAGLHWMWLSRLQTVDGYKYATGAVCFFFSDGNGTCSWLG